MATAIERAKSVGGLIASRSAMINSLFKSEEDAKRFRAIAVSVTSNYKLADCTDDSLISCVMGVAQLRLSVDPNLGHAYIIPYQVKDKNDKNKVKCTIAQLQIGYRGFIQLLSRAGLESDTYPVYDTDKFEIAFNNEKMAFTYDFEVNFDDREDDDNDWVYKHLKGVLVVIRSADGIKTEFISKAKIEKMRLKSENQDNPKKPAHIWADWYEEMARKSSLKKVAKQQAIGDEKVALAIAIDDKISSGQHIDVEKSFSEGVIIDAETEPTPQNDKPKNINANPLFVLKNKLKKQGVTDVDSFCKQFEITAENAGTMVDDEAGLQALIEKFNDDSIEA